MNILLQNKKNKNVHYKKQTNTTKLNINQLSEGKIEFQPLKNKNKKGWKESKEKTEIQNKNK